MIQFQGVDGSEADSFRSEAGSAVDAVARGIADGVAAGRYAPGQRLIEADLTEAWHVGRSTVREAFRRLAGEGLLELERHRGARVRRLTRADIAELYRVRRVLEALAARIAAERIAAGADPAPVRALLEAQGGATRRSALAYTHDNADFHDGIVRFAGNRVLAQQVAALRLQMFRLQVGTMLTPERIRQSASHHRRIAEAVLAGRPDAAARAMDRHIRLSELLVNRLPDEVFAG